MTFGAQARTHLRNARSHYLPLCRTYTHSWSPRQEGTGTRSAHMRIRKKSEYLHELTLIQSNPFIGSSSGARGSSGLHELAAASCAAEEDFLLGRRSPFLADRFGRVANILFARSCLFFLLSTVRTTRHLDSSSYVRLRIRGRS